MPTTIPAISSLLASPMFMQQYDTHMQGLYGPTFDKSPVVFINTVTQHYATLLSMMYAFNPTTGEHLYHSERIANHIANKLDLDEFDRFGITLGAMLHDVGKVGIDRRILGSTGPLSAGDRTVIETHAEIGRAMLTHLPTPWKLEDYAHMHHERLDGSGYPNGLLAPQLSQNIRIMTVVDVAEALMADRLYRTPWTQTAVIDYLYARSHQYDATLVKQLETLKI